jgi:phosphopantetheinyl transferase
MPSPTSDNSQNSGGPLRGAFTGSSNPDRHGEDRLGLNDMHLWLLDGHEVPRTNWATKQGRREGLKLLLARYLPEHAGDLELACNQHGKPFVLGGQLHFNLTHSHGLTIIAVSRTEVGVDVEKMVIPRGGYPLLQQIGRRLLTPDDSTHRAGLDDAQYLDAFYQTWTQVEAYSKLLGRGLSYPPTRTAVWTDERGYPRVVDDYRATPYFMHRLKVSAGYCAHLCTSLAAPRLLYLPAHTRHRRSI